MTTSSVSVDPGRTLAELVADNPTRVNTLEHLGLDYCCHGERTLADACIEAALDVEAVARELVTGPANSDARPAPSDPADLASHIEATHHVYLRAELPAVAELARKVRAVHGARHPELADVEELVDAMSAELAPHFAIEEQLVFPVARGAAPVDGLPARIAELRHDHDALGALLANLRATTGQYRPPADGCASYTSLYERLARLEADTHIHIHLENNVLLPAILQLPASPP